MKRFFQLLMCGTLFLGITAPAWGQSSTEGTEFWVALNMTVGTAGGDHQPFICITTQHPGGSYTITNPADPSFTPITGLIPPTGYVKITAKVNPNSGDIDLNKCYPVGKTAANVSNQTKDVGLKITTTVESSVFVGNRLTRSFDAANILPITALQTNYITQDYPGYDHESNTGGGYPVNTILATEDDTHVTIEPSSSVLNSNGTATINKTLKAGQVLYLTGENRATLSGTVITSDKKIAVFSGVNNTDIPGPVSARDHLYEQNMPTDYWGTHFVLTRSMKKDANRIRVTALNAGTTLKVDGQYLTTIGAGQTYEFELCEAAMRTQSCYTSTDASKGAVGAGRGCDYFFEGEAHYLETSCPCAVFSYDVSENYYIKNGTSERDPNSAGDPAMVWISPLEQQLRKITFGVMNTDKTPTHYVNIITPTNGAASLEVREIAMNAGKVVYGKNLVTPTDVKPVPGNPAYSYARIKLTENAESVYTIKSNIGFIAHVYGSGDKESYAYSCGSAAVVQGVRVNGFPFTNGYRSEEKFCMNEVFNFDAAVGTDEIERVDWDFGDGTTEPNGPAQTTHQYTSPGWYDVTAELFGRQVCTTNPTAPLGKVEFTFRVWRKDTVTVIGEPECISLDGKIGDKQLTKDEIDKLLKDGDRRVDPGENCYDSDTLKIIKYSQVTETKDTTTAQDQVVYNGVTYTKDTTIVDTTFNEYGCYIIHNHFIHPLKCHDFGLESYGEIHLCPGDAQNIVLSYKKTKGDIQNPIQYIIYNQIAPNDTLLKKSINITDNEGTITLPTETMMTPGIYHCILTVGDAMEGCDAKEFNILFYVNYPSDIFKYKFNNVLAVYNPGYGGNRIDFDKGSGEDPTNGWVFTAYQWCVIREGRLLDLSANQSATTNVLYLGDGVTFEKGDILYVILTDTVNKKPIPSCPQTINVVPDYKPTQPSNAPAKKMIQNQHMVIQKGEALYDIYGQRIQ